MAFRGATGALDPSGGPDLVVDLGGGSTELVAGGDDPDAAPTAVVSLDIGCVRVTERFLAHDPPEAAELASARTYVRGVVDDALDKIPALKEPRRMVGVAGTISTLAALALGLDGYDPEKVHLALALARRRRKLARHVGRRDRRAATGPGGDRARSGRRHRRRRGGARRGDGGARFRRARPFRTRHLGRDRRGTPRLDRPLIHRRDGLDRTSARRGDLGTQNELGGAGDERVDVAVFRERVALGATGENAAERRVDDDARAPSNNSPTSRYQRPPFAAATCAFAAVSSGTSTGTPYSIDSIARRPTGPCGRTSTVNVACATSREKFTRL